MRHSAWKWTSAICGVLFATWTMAAGAQISASRPEVGIACSLDSVLAGTLCVDKYEASVWTLLLGSAALREKLKAGAVTLADLVNGGATQRGAGVDDYPCSDTGAGCRSIFAASVKDAVPSTHVTWAQAAAACRNSGKRLLTNYEYQVAAFGTPKMQQLGVSDGPCRARDQRGLTGTEGCRSDVGAYDMEGNVGEWLADWRVQDTFCGASDTDPVRCANGWIGFTNMEALYRIGGFRDNFDGSQTIIGASGWVNASDPAVGFRCGRDAP
jgi:hypothetical protein